MELAVFGSIVVMLLGALVGYGLSFDYTQQANMRTFRNALADSSAMIDTLPEVRAKCHDNFITGKDRSYQWACECLRHLNPYDPAFQRGGGARNVPTRAGSCQLWGNANVNIIEDRHAPDPGSPSGLGGMAPASAAVGLTRDYRAYLTPEDDDSVPRMRMVIQGEDFNCPSAKDPSKGLKGCTTAGLAVFPKVDGFIPRDVVDLNNEAGSLEDDDEADPIRGFGANLGSINDEKRTIAQECADIPAGSDPELAKAMAKRCRKQKCRNNPESINAIDRMEQVFGGNNVWPVEEADCYDYDAASFRKCNEVQWWWIPRDAQKYPDACKTAGNCCPANAPKWQKDPHLGDRMLPVPMNVIDACNGEIFTKERCSGQARELSDGKFCKQQCERGRRLGPKWKPGELPAGCKPTGGGSVGDINLPGGGRVPGGQAPGGYDCSGLEPHESADEKATCFEICSAEIKPLPWYADKCRYVDRPAGGQEFVCPGLEQFFMMERLGKDGTPVKLGGQSVMVPIESAGLQPDSIRRNQLDSETIRRETGGGALTTESRVWWKEQVTRPIVYGEKTGNGNAMRSTTAPVKRDVGLEASQAASKRCTTLRSGVTVCEQLLDKPSWDTHQFTKPTERPTPPTSP
jgi:hypothetical protein